MVRFLLIVLGIFSFVAFSAPVSAQSFNNERWVTHERLQRYAASKFKYQKWLISAKGYYNGRPGQFPIYTLLDAYIGGEYYDPFAQETIDRLYEYAFIADTATDTQEAEKAANNFQSLMDWHLPNYTILKSAIPLVRANPILGDIKFLEWMYRQVVGYILKAGTGHSIQSAYPIYSVDDENFIIKNANVKIIDTEIINNGNEYYHIHLTEDLQSGRPGKIYTNMTPVMKYIVTVNKIQNPDYTYPLGIPENFE